MNTTSYQEIKFITDQQEGEPNILEKVKNESLKIFSDNDDGNSEVAKEIAPPAGGWTHELLINLDQSAFEIKWVGEAFIGGRWVGGTEV